MFFGARFTKILIDVFHEEVGGWHWLKTKIFNHYGSFSKKNIFCCQEEISGRKVTASLSSMTSTKVVQLVLFFIAW